MDRTNMRSNHLVNIYQYQITVNIASLFAPYFSSTKFWTWEKNLDLFSNKS